MKADVPCFNVGKNATAENWYEKEDREDKYRRIICTIVKIVIRNLFQLANIIRSLLLAMKFRRHWHCCQDVVFV